MNSTIVKHNLKSNDMEWNSEEEIQLLFALEGLKPVGINKHFYMMCISDRLSKALNREITSETIWTHLKTMYNFEMLDQMKVTPFVEEGKDFELPQDEFSSLMMKKIAETESKNLDETSADQPSTSKGKSATTHLSTSSNKVHGNVKDDKKLTPKSSLSDITRHFNKRTRGSTSLESPSTTPPPTQSSKRRRI